LLLPDVSTVTVNDASIPPEGLSHPRPLRYGLTEEESHDTFEGAPVNTLYDPPEVLFRHEDQTEQSSCPSR
jgi:hypothetical protein